MTKGYQYSRMVVYLFTNNRYRVHGQGEGRERQTPGIRPPSGQLPLFGPGRSPGGVWGARGRFDAVNQNQMWPSALEDAFAGGAENRIRRLSNYSVSEGRKWIRRVRGTRRTRRGEGEWGRKKNEGEEEDEEEEEQQAEQEEHGEEEE